MKMSTDSNFSQFLEKLKAALGGELLCIFLHGSISEQQGQDGSDDDLFVVVTDMSVQKSRFLTARIRHSSQFQKLNLSINVGGYNRLYEQLSIGDPFCLAAVRDGDPLYDPEGRFAVLKERVDKDRKVDTRRLTAYLMKQSAQDLTAAKTLFRDCLFRLFNAVQTGAQAEILLRAKDEMELSPVIGRLADWRNIDPILEKMLKVPAGQRETLNALERSKKRLSRFERPEIGGDLYDAFEQVFKMFNRLAEKRRKGGSHDNG